MTFDEAIAALEAQIEPGRAEGMAAYHKVDRPYLGVPNPALNDLAKEWRGALSVDAQVALASALWDSNIFEARVLAGKLLTKARYRPDQAVWDLIASWVPSFDSWAIADHACSAGQKRLVMVPERVEEVEIWTTSDHMWTRRAALVVTLPWAKKNFPKPQDIEIRERVLGWAARYAEDQQWFIQKAIAWWVRDLSKHDAARAQAFLNDHGDKLKPFARKEAGRLITASDGAAAK